ncbi:MAG: hypothetical protein AAGF24_09060 [Cyanobacteria bacterium P01_H01_bin.121]
MSKARDWQVNNCRLRQAIATIEPDMPNIFQNHNGRDWLQWACSLRGTLDGWLDLITRPRSQCSEEWRGIVREALAVMARIDAAINQEVP